MRSTDLFASHKNPSDPVAGEDCVPENGTQGFEAESLYRYAVYGISLISPIRLSLPKQSGAGLLEIELRMVPTSFFTAILEGTQLQQIGRCSYQYAHLQDGSSYVRWEGIGEFLVSAGGRLISCARFPDASLESFQVYLLGQALSFALVKSGFEPVHATCVVINGEAVAFLGHSGFGKSSLAAWFLQAGDQLLTDDLLLVRQGIGGLQAYPGPPRIKLLPEMAQRLLGSHASGVLMNPQAKKLIIPLEGEHVCATPVPLRALYALVHPPEPVQQQDIHIRRLAPREAFINLLSHTFNRAILDGDRLQRQLREMVRLTHTLPLSELSYPRRIESISAVREAILSDLCGDKSGVSACGA